jgi:predicted nucleic acid-binding protein
VGTAMSLQTLPTSANIFVDANIFIYHFASEPTYGSACAQFFQRVANHEIKAFSSMHVIGEVLHRLMTYEAYLIYKLPMQSMVARLKTNPQLLANLQFPNRAIQAIQTLPLTLLPITLPTLQSCIAISQSQGLLTNDAITLALMQHYQLTNLASNDADFDIVPGITRYVP